VKDTVDKGTKSLSLSMLSHLVCGVDETAAELALHHLLWCSVTGDFETRSKAVSMLCS